MAEKTLQELLDEQSQMAQRVAGQSPLASKVLSRAGVAPPDGGTQSTRNTLDAAAGARLGTFPSSFATGPLSHPSARELATPSVMENAGQMPDLKGPLVSIGGQFTPQTLAGFKAQDEGAAFQRGLENQFPTMQTIQSNLQGPSNYLVHGGERSSDDNNKTYLASLDAYAKMQNAKTAMMGVTSNRDIENAKLGQAREFELGGAQNPGGRFGLAQSQNANEQTRLGQEAYKLTPDYTMKNAAALALSQGLVRTEGEAKNLNKTMHALGGPAGAAIPGLGGGGPANSLKSPVLPGGPPPTSQAPAVPGGTPPIDAWKMDPGAHIAELMGGVLSPDKEKAIQSGQAPASLSHDAITQVLKSVPDEAMNDRIYFNTLNTEMGRKFGNQWTHYLQDGEGFGNVGEKTGNQTERQFQLRRMIGGYKNIGGGDLRYRHKFLGLSLPF